MALAKVRALHPEVEFDVVYDGDLPSRSADYYDLATEISKRAAYVYLLYAGDRLLYVGRAGQPGNRFDRHKRQKDWWPSVDGLLLLKVKGADLRDVTGLAAALELAAIHKLSPVHNIAGVTV